MDILTELEKHSKVGSYYYKNDSSEKVLTLLDAKHVFDLWLCERLQHDQKLGNLAYTESKQNAVKSLRYLAYSIESGMEVESQKAAQAIKAASAYL
jgi:hypothetical protein